MPFKNVLREKVPFNIKRLLINKIIWRYKSLSFEIFEDEVFLLSEDEILKMFLYSDNKTIYVILSKMFKYGHPILSNKEAMINLAKRKCNIIQFVNLENFTQEEINTLKNYLKFDLYSDAKKVKLHEKIFEKYKFKYDSHELLPNGIYYSNFINMAFNNKLDKFLYNFLSYSGVVEIIYDNYYEKYKSLIIKKHGEEKFQKVDDIYNFMKFILAEKEVNNEIVMPNLEMIYQKLNLTNIQIDHIKGLMCSIDPSYDEKINRFLMRQRTIALSKYNAIVRMHLDGVNVSEALSKIGLNKDELISQIIKMRNLDKKEKSTLIDLLKKEKYILTIGDILGLLQEMEENDYTIDEVLRLNGINKKYFYTIYKELIYTNPELHKKIKEALLNNKKRGFKKYIKLAYYITTLDFNDEEDFKNMFPEINLDEMIKKMEKLGKINLVTKLKEIKEKIHNKNLIK